MRFRGIGSDGHHTPRPPGPARGPGDPAMAASLAGLQCVLVALLLLPTAIGSGETAGAGTLDQDQSSGLPPVWRVLTACLKNLTVGFSPHSSRSSSLPAT